MAPALAGRRAHVVRDAIVPFFVCIFGLVAAASELSSVQDPTVGDVRTVWVRRVSGEALLENRTPEQAIQTARDEAYAEALKRVGLRVTSAQFLVQSEAISSASSQHDANTSFANVVHSMTQGFVTSVENERLQVINVQADSSRPPILQYRVTLDACVTMPSGEADPDFHVSAKLDQPSYRHGADIRLEVRATKACYLHIFNVAADSAILILPSAHSERNQAGPDATLMFPPSDLRWTAMLPRGWNTSEELLLIVATKSDRSFRLGGIVGNAAYVATRHAALMDVLGWTASLPRQDVCIAVEHLRIVQK